VLVSRNYVSGPEFHCAQEVKPINDTLKVLTLFVAILALAELGLLFREATGVIRATRPLVVETDKRLDGTFRNLNAILIQAGLVAACVEDLSRNMDAAATRQGKYWEAIQEKTIASLDKLNDSADALTALLTNTDNSINGRLVPATAESLDSIEAVSQEAFGGLSEASGRANDSLDDIHRLLSDPAWTAPLDSAQPDFQCGGASIFLRRSYESISADRCRTEETVGDHRIAERPKCC
jgi:hypothetical protein